MQTLHLMSSEHVLESHIQCQSDTQLFITYGIQEKGKPISKQWLIKLLVEYIKYTYDKNDRG